MPAYSNRNRLGDDIKSRSALAQVVRIGVLDSGGGLYTPTMCIHGFSLLLILAGNVSMTAQTGLQAVSVSFPAGQSTKALDGRLLLLLSNDPSEEPRMQIDDTQGARWSSA